MRHVSIRDGMIVLLTGLGALLAGHASAQETPNGLEILSVSWGIAPGQTAHHGVLNVGLGDGSVRGVRADDPVIVRIQLLDTEGDVIAQSDEITVAPGHIGVWEVRHDQISRRLTPEPGVFTCEPEYASRQRRLMSIAPGRRWCQRCNSLTPARARACSLGRASIPPAFSLNSQPSPSGSVFGLA